MRTQAGDAMDERIYSHEFQHKNYQKKSPRLEY